MSCWVDSLTANPNRQMSMCPGFLISAFFMPIATDGGQTRLDKKLYLVCFGQCDANHHRNAKYDLLHS